MWGRKGVAKIAITDWVDCVRFRPYRDYLGQWRWPLQTQRRSKLIDGSYEYREREETTEDWGNRQL
jgi:hypothetical protein